MQLQIFDYIIGFIFYTPDKGGGGGGGKVNIPGQLAPTPAIKCLKPNK